MQQLKSLKNKIYGVDFSGAKDAGNKIWIAECTVEDNIFQVEKCTRASELFKSGSNRDECFTSLREFITGENDSIFGIDFPFGLPHDLIEENSWEDFVVFFPDNYSGPEKFRRKCQTKTTHERKRLTDVECRTPFSPYNLRVYKQTYFGIHDILAPLVEADLVCVLPMQVTIQSIPWIIEICPASTLKALLKLNKIPPYKGNTPMHYNNRIEILDKIVNNHPISVPEDIRSIAGNDNGGDALDSIVAAVATFRALDDLYKGHAIKMNEDYAIEGFIFL